MADNLDALNTAVSLIIRAALLAARFSGRVRQRYLRCLAGQDVDAKAKEILFLKDRVYQLEMQVSILQKHLDKKGKQLYRRSIWSEYRRPAAVLLLLDRRRWSHWRLTGTQEE